MLWTVLLVVFVILLLAAKWLLTHGTFHWSHNSGMSSFSASSDNPTKILSISEIPYLVEKLIERNTFEWLGFSRPGHDEPNVSFMWIGDRELRLDASFKTANGPELADTIKKLMGKFLCMPVEDDVWNEGMGSEHEIRTVAFRVPPRRDLLLQITNSLIENYIKPEGEELSVWVGHGDDLPKSHGLSWKRNRDRLGEVLAEATAR